MSAEESLPLVIDIQAYDSGFIASIDKKLTYYPDLENLAKAIYPHVRKELTPTELCVGSC